jgi:hypothetical protein
MKPEVVKEWKGRKYQYKEIVVPVGKGWYINHLWGTYGPVTDYDAKNGRLYIRLKKLIKGGTK